MRVRKWIHGRPWVLTLTWQWIGLQHMLGTDGNYNRGGSLSWHWMWGSRKYTTRCGQRGRFLYVGPLCLWSRFIPTGVFEEDC